MDKQIEFDPSTFYKSDMLNYRFDITHTIAAETLAPTTYDAIISLCNTHLIPLDSSCTTLHSLTQYLARQGYEFRQRVPDVNYHPSRYSPYEF